MGVTKLTTFRNLAFLVNYWMGPFFSDVSAKFCQIKQQQT